MAAGTLAPEDGLRELCDGPRQPLYLWLGEAVQWKEGLLDELRVRLAGRFLVQTFGADESVAEILGLARVVPMLDEGYIFVLREAEKLPAEGLERLAGYLARPSPFATVIVSATAPDRRRSGWKRLLEAAPTVDFGAPRPEALAGWVRQAAAAAGIRIEPEAVEFLVAQAAGRPDEVRERVALLALALAPGETATRALCEDLFVTVHEESIWRLVDALVARDGQGALSAAAALLEEGEEPIALLGFLYGRFRLACLAQHHRARQGSLEDLARSLGTKPFALQKLLPWGRDWSEDQRRAVRRMFADADRQMKTSGGKPGHILEHLVCQLAHA
ncbi:DNA polymerase III subunit delta [bacterium]|nr:DNA polymerase III subunit delta [bacterium]